MLKKSNVGGFGKYNSGQRNKGNFLGLLHWVLLKRSYLPQNLVKFFSCKP